MSPIRSQFAASAALLLAAWAQDLAGADSASGSTKARWTAAVLVAANGEVRSWDPSTPPPSAAEFALDHAWVWSSALPARRLARDEFDHAPHGQTPSWPQLTLESIAADSSQPREDLTVLAAPVAMWREVPEELLPRWPTPAQVQLRLPRDGTEAIRVRAVSKNLASAWQDVEPTTRRVALALEPAREPSIRVRGSEGEPLSGAVARLELPLPSRRSPAVMASWQADSEGLVRGLPLPTRLMLQTYFFHPAALPKQLSGAIVDWPGEIRLGHGCTLNGRLVDPEGRGIAGARLVGEAWLDSGSEIVVRRDIFSDNAGSFRLGPLPPEISRFRIEKAGFATRLVELSLSNCARLQNVGDVLLNPSSPVLVKVETEARRPVAHAAVLVDGHMAGVTDSRGQLRLRHLETHSFAHFEVRADGYLAFAAQRSIAPDAPVVIRLEPAAVLSGRLVQPDRTPAAGGQVLVLLGQASREVAIGADGGFRVDLEPFSAARLLFLVDGLRDMTLEVEAGGPGESRSLGDIVLERGLVVHARLLDRSSGAAIMGATAWVPRAHPGGPLVASVLGQQQRAYSDAEGAFRLSGLSEAPFELRLEASGFAARSVPVIPEMGTEEMDLGEITLSRGIFLDVTFDIEELAGSLVAQPELGGELARMRSPFTAGTGRVGPLPPGTTRFWAEVGRRTLCERELTLDEETEEVTVECGGEPIRVVGEASSGDGPAEGGHLMWLPAEASGGGALVLRRSSPLGAGRTDVYGAGRPQVDVDLSPGGQFSTDELSSGIWRVLWSARAGSFSRPLEVRISSEPEQFVRLRFEGGDLTGRVAFSDGRAAPSARVSLVGRPEWALAGADGGFRIVGLPEGDYVVRATLEGKETAGHQVAIRAGDAAEPIELVLTEGKGRSLAVELLSRELSVSGALVIVELAGGSLRLLTADGQGRVSVSIPEPPPDAVRIATVASGTWAFGRWLPLQEETTRYELEVGDAGTLIVESPTARIIGLWNDSGWDIAAALRILGVSLGVGADHPLVLGGLPAATYSLVSGNEVRPIEISAGGITRVGLSDSGRFE